MVMVVGLTITPLVAAGEKKTETPDVGTASVEVCGVDELLHVKLDGVKPAPKVRVVVQSVSGVNNTFTDTPCRAEVGALTVIVGTSYPLVWPHDTLNAVHRSRLSGPCTLHEDWVNNACCKVQV